MLLLVFMLLVLLLLLLLLTLPQDFNGCERDADAAMN